MPKKVKAYELDAVLELLSTVYEKSDDIVKRLEAVYDLGPALEERDVGELGEILESVDDVIEDFQYSLATYMAGAGIEFEKEEEEEVPQQLEEPSGLEKFIEEKFEWEDEEEEEAEEEEIDPALLEEQEYENFYKDLLERGDS